MIKKIWTALNFAAGFFSIVQSGQKHAAPETNDDERVGIIATVGIFLLIGSVPLHLGIAVLFHFFSNHRDYARERVAPPVSPVEIDSGVERETLMRAQRSLLNRYEWVDE